METEEDDLKLPPQDPMLDLVGRILVANPANASRQRPTHDMRVRFLLSDIPYRLQAIDGLSWFFERPVLGPKRHKLDVRVNGAAMPPRLFTNAVFEMGLASLRAQAEFLGFKVSRKDGLLISADRNGNPDSDDACLEHLVSRGALSLEEAREAGAASPQETDAALAYALRMANKAVAHLTYGELGGKPAPLKLAAESVWRLTVKHLYMGESDITNQFRYPAHVAEAVGAVVTGEDDIGSAAEGDRDR